ncbi:MAG: TraM recognition domain-containing protein [Rhizobiales bacterium]|nr:TraM recognition domain-containing protein [Hyphomicrobiales bacterium]
MLRLIGQLRNLYQEQTQTIISNSAVRLFFGTNDAERAMR